MNHCHNCSRTVGLLLRHLYRVIQDKITTRPVMEPPRPTKTANPPELVWILDCWLRGIRFQGKLAGNWNSDYLHLRQNPRKFLVILLKNDFRNHLPNNQDESSGDHLRFPVWQGYDQAGEMPLSTFPNFRNRSMMFGI